MLYAGIDLHKYYQLITDINDGGHQVSQVRLNNNRLLVKNYFGQFTESVKIVVEATLNWYWLVDLLDELNYHIVLAHPKKLRSIVEAKLENDKISSFMLAQLLRNNFIPEAYCLSPEIRALRDLCRTRLFFVRQRTALVNNCHSTLLKHNIVAPSKGKLHSSSGLAYLKNPDLELHEISKLGLNCKSDLIKILTEKIKSLEYKIKRYCIEDEIIKLLKTIPGIGDVLSPTIRYEIGEITRFKSHKHLASYSRYTQKIHQSGRLNKHYNTSKEGNAYLKWAFSEVVINAIRFDKDIRKCYQRHLSKKGKPVAKAIIGRNLTTVVFNVWTNNESYKGFKVSKKNQSN